MLLTLRQLVVTKENNAIFIVGQGLSIADRNKVRRELQMVRNIQRNTAWRGWWRFGSKKWLRRKQVINCNMPLIRMAAGASANDWWAVADG